MAETGLSQNYFRDYDPAVGRYTESDPIGLRGSEAASIAYVSSNPPRFIDPRGLTKWYGQVHSYGAAAGIGADFAIYTLTSECKGGTQAWVKVYATGPAGGADIKGLPPFSGTYDESLVFDDKTNVADPNIFNGAFLSWDAGFVPGIGGSCHSTKLGGPDVGHGGAVSNECGWSFGFHIGAGGAVGSSTVMASDVSDCACGNGNRK